MARIRYKLKTTEEQTAGAKKHIEESLQAYYDISGDVAILTAKLHELEQSMYQQMKEFGIDKVMLDKIMAERYTPKGRVTNVVDPAGYQALVSQSEFYDSISVSMTKAKKYLSGKQLEKITTVIPPESKEETIKITISEQ
jgi:hypothetical protein